MFRPSVSIQQIVGQIGRRASFREILENLSSECNHRHNSDGPHCCLSDSLARIYQQDVPRPIVILAHILSVWHSLSVAVEIRTD